MTASLLDMLTEKRVELLTRIEIGENKMTVFIAGLVGIPIGILKLLAIKG
jgi:hypothetical protein